MTGEILYTVGDDPLSELADMDRFYGWTRRSARLRSLFERRRSIVPWIILVGVSSAVLLSSYGVLVYLAFYA